MIPLAIEHRSGVDRHASSRGGRRADDDAPAPLHTLTTKQRQLLEAIAEISRATGEPCTANYLARRFNVHHTTLREHLQALYRRGWLLTPNAPAMLRQPLDDE